MSSRTGPPRLVAATDDRRILDPDFAGRLEALLVAGLPGVLIRATRALDDRAFLTLLTDAVGRCRRHGAELWVGDRVDLALAVGADAVHLPERGLSVAGARALAPGLRIGRSVHGVRAAVEAARMGADHLVVGAMFETPSHPGRGAVGLALLGGIRDALGSAAPALFAVGGLTPERVAEALAAGATGVVAIRALWGASDPARAVERFAVALGQRPSGGRGCNLGL